MPRYHITVDEELAHGLLSGGTGLGELVKQVLELRREDCPCWADVPTA